MNSIVARAASGSPGRRGRPSSRIMPALLACVSFGVFSGAAPVKEQDTPEGVHALIEAAKYLTRGTGQWRAPYTSSSGGPDAPDAVGLWFDLAAQSWLLELTVVFYYGDKVEPYSKSYWFWHPGRQEVQYHEVNPGGSIRMGTMHFSDERTFVTLTDAIGMDGKTKPNRGENVMLSEDEHLTIAYVKDAAGEWVASNEHTWKRVPESEQKGK